MDDVPITEQTVAQVSPLVFYDCTYWLLSTFRLTRIPTCVAVQMADLSQALTLL